MVLEEKDNFIMKDTEKSNTSSHQLLLLLQGGIVGIDPAQTPNKHGQVGSGIVEIGTLISDEQWTQTDQVDLANGWGRIEYGSIHFRPDTYYINSHPTHFKFESPISVPVLIYFRVTRIDPFFTWIFYQMITLKIFNKQRNTLNLSNTKTSTHTKNIHLSNADIRGENIKI